MRTLRLFLLMAVMMCSLAVNAQGSETICTSFTLQQHNDSLMSDAELLKSIAKDSSATRLKRARRLKWTAWIGGGVFFVASAYCLCGTAVVAYNNQGTGTNYYAIGAAAFFGASVAWTTSFLVAAHHQKKMALSANINMLNDNITNRKALGIGFNFSF